MVRLTNAARDDMTRDLLKHSFRDKAEEICIRSNALFDVVHEDHYDLETQSLMDKLLKRHRSAFEYASQRNVNVGGYSLTIGQNAIGHGTVKFSVDRPRRAIIKSIESRIAYSDCDTAVALRQLADDIKALQAEIKAAYERLRATLGQITTAKQLEEQWPESLPIVERYIPAAPGNLPAIPFARLTAELGLSPVEARNA